MSRIQRQRRTLVILTLVSVLLCIGYLAVHDESQANEEDTHDHPSRQLFFRFIPRIISFFKTLIKGFVYRWKVPELYYNSNPSRPPDHTTAIIIGSGFGGAITALRLAQAGIPTTVLERGQDWPISPRRQIHTFETLRDGRGVWHRTSLRMPLAAAYAPVLPVDYFGGVLDVTEYDTMEVWRGACVGGGSKVFTGVMIQPQQEYFDTIFDNQVSYDDMDQVYYPRVRSMLNLQPVPDDIYNSPYFAHRRLWDEQAVSAGYEVERPDSIFNWDIIRDEMEGRSRKSATIGLSNMGNSNGAKYDLTQNYLKMALETEFVTVYSNQQVETISKTDSGGFRVSIQKLSPKGNVVDEYTITSDYLFLAAGSIGTSELLVKAKAEGTISNLNEHIGQGWGANGDSITTRVLNPLRGLNQAAPCTGLIRDTTGPLPITFESWYVPGTPIDISVQGSLGIAFDMENRGHFEYVNGKVELVWPRDGNDKAEEAARRINDKMANEGIPRSFPGIPLLAPDVYTGFTAHPLGGAVLGKATDTFGRVQGVDRLYVMDGAAIPGSTGATNPSLTISALAERNIEEIIRQDFS